ncbi:MAG: hypothetical protein ACRCSI_07055 [Eubacterium aggregans]
MAQSIHKRHDHYGDKYKNWALAPSRPLLFLGDSNLGQVPPSEDGRIEVDYYPGANLAQAYHVIKHKTPRSPGVQHVVLSFGLNNREQGNPVLLGKSVERVLGAAAQAFPSAVVHIPLINYSKALPTRFIDNLKVLNDIILKTGHSIPLLPWESFRTNEDKIHWTPVTARAMLKHWLSQLNSDRRGPQGGAPC